MKVCSKCNIEKDDSDFRKIKNKMCRLGYYVSGSCRECANKTARERDRERRATEIDYVLRCRERVKSYQKTEKGKISKKKCAIKYKDKRNDYYKKNATDYYKKRLSRLKIEIETISDEYVITQLQNTHRKVTYSRQYLKEHKEIIELYRTQILQKRLKRAIEKKSKFGICNKCKKVVLKSEFRISKTKELKKYTIHLCRSCQKELSKENWEKYKIKRQKSNEFSGSQ